MKKISLATPHMGGEELFYVNDAFNKNWIAPLGENVDSFESEIASYVGSKYGAALSSGTAALHMAVKSAGVEAGDVVFCSSLTFSASANPIIYQNATPVFIDSDDDNWGMSPEALEKAYEKYPDPKAVIVVHLYGQPCKMKEILEICASHGTPVIEDAAESLGATYNGKQTGTFGKFGVFSFNGNKIITTSGGGMLVSEDESAIKKVRYWSTQAREPERYYHHTELGFNYRMSNICAGIGRGQLKVLDERIAQKTNIFLKYQEGFKDIPCVSMNPVTENSVPNYWLSCIRLDNTCKKTPLEIIEFMEKNGVECRHIWKPMHMQPFYKDCDFITTKETGSYCEDIFNSGLCLPSDTKMTEEDISYVISLIKSFLI